MAESKLKEAKGLAVTSSSTTVTNRIKEQKEPPVGSEIVSKTIRTETEEIENGWLISKNFDITYKEKGDKSGYTKYAYYTKKWYSKTDPLSVKLTDASLADEFNDED